MSDTHEAALDQLFQLLPAQLVEARNALAERLRKAGDKAAAAAVKALKRPTPGAWAVNQVHFRAPDLLAQAERQATELRALHAAEGAEPRQVWAAAHAQRNAINAVVETALGYCEQEGLASGAAQQRKILLIVQGWLAGASSEAPGRMTTDLEAGGFDAVQSVGDRASPGPLEALPMQVPAESPPSAAVATVEAEGSAREQKEESRARARVERRRREALLAEARELVRTCRADYERKERERDRERASVAEAERRLSELRARVHDRDQELAQLGSELEAALTREDDAARSLEEIADLEPAGER